VVRPLARASEASGSALSRAWRDWFLPPRRSVQAGVVSVPDRRTSLFVLLVATLAAGIALAITAENDLTTAFHDSRSRLTIARAVVDNRQPGFSQLGTVWLPLHMLAMAPTIWIDWMYRSGASGIILSLTSIVATIFYSHRYAYLLTRSGWGSAVAVLAVVLSLNFMLVGINPMSEAPFAALSIAGWYYLARWAGTQAIADLMLASLLIGASTLVRYDGWFSVVPGTLFITVVCMRERGRLDAQRLEAQLVAFLSIPAFTMMLWVFYNTLIFGSPLAFATGAGSAAEFATQYAQQTDFTARGDLIEAVRVFGWTMVDTIGPIVLLAGAVGIVVGALAMRGWVAGLVLLLPASVIAFNVISLYVGASVVLNQHVTPELDLTNVRYGVLAIPFAAVGIATLASYNRLFLVLAIAAPVIQVGVWLGDGPIVTVRDTRQGLFDIYHRGADAFNETYDHGLVLVSFRDHAAGAPLMDVPISVFIHEGVNLVSPTYDEAIRNPAAHVRYIVLREDGLGDLDERIGAVQLRDFELVGEVYSDRIYRIRPEAEQRERARAGGMVERPAP
jgi:hypothetical protein